MPHAERASQPSHADDERWIALVRLGDRAAFSEMYGAYAPRLASYVLTIVDAEDAEEIIRN